MFSILNANYSLVETNYGGPFFSLVLRYIILILSRPKRTVFFFKKTVSLRRLAP